MSDDEPLRYCFQTCSDDPELRLVDILVQVMLSHDTLSNAQRWRTLDYLNDRFGRPVVPPSTEGEP